MFLFISCCAILSVGFLNGYLCCKIFDSNKNNTDLSTFSNNEKNINISTDKIYLGK